MDSELKKELKTFRELSSQEDYKLINEETITFQDYQRLSYIIATLELSHLEIHFFKKHYDRFEKQFEELIKLDNEYEVYVDEDTLDNWLKSFANNISNDNKKKHIRKLLKLD